MRADEDVRGMTEKAEERVLLAVRSEPRVTSGRRRTPWYLWPFVVVWRLLAFILEMTGRLVGIILGAVLLIAGVVISLTVIGAIVGVPIAILGLLLIVRGLF